MDSNIYEKKKILITVTTYPLPSRSYDELVCTAGLLEDGAWIRIYPVPFKFLKFSKYQWIELSVRKRTDDFRPESYSPQNPDLSDIVEIKKLDTFNFWAERKLYCLKKVYNSMNQLINDSKAPFNTSLATFKPKKILDFIIEADDREWKKEWLEQFNQMNLFEEQETPNAPRQPIKKVPYKFKYKFITEDNTQHTLMIEDWEIGALYWNCLKSENGDEKKACQKVRQKYWDELVLNRDTYLFLGTTKEWHFRRAKNPFVIIGVFYPMMNPNENQISLF